MNGTTSFSTGVIRWPRLLYFVALGFACQACAVNYLDADGDRHVIGLVDITVHPPAEPQTFAGDVVDLTVVGLVASETLQGGYVSLGYSREVVATLRDNVLVFGDALHPLSRVNQPMSQ